MYIIVHTTLYVDTFFFLLVHVYMHIAKCKANTANMQPQKLRKFGGATKRLRTIHVHVHVASNHNVYAECGVQLHVYTYTLGQNFPFILPPCPPFLYHP